jgi:hypothetical protein
MKPFALANRLSRDLSEKSLSDLPADVLLEIADAINGAIQKMDAIAPFHSKTTTASIALDAPVTVSIGVTNGSTTITGATFTESQFGRTIRIGGDDIENQVVGTTDLLHPFSGTTGTVSAVIYGDATPLPESYAAITSDPQVLETRRFLAHQKIPRTPTRKKLVDEPRFYWVESNARNQNPSAPGIVRVDSLPDQVYRLEFEAELAPVRVTVADFHAPGDDLPIRAQHVENYLLPIARGLLTTSSLWRDKDTKSKASADGETAEIKYEALVPRYLSTPSNHVLTHPGF